MMLQLESNNVLALLIPTFSTFVFELYNALNTEELQILNKCLRFLHSSGLVEDLKIKLYKGYEFFDGNTTKMDELFAKWKAIEIMYRQMYTVGIQKKNPQQMFVVSYYDKLNQELTSEFSYFKTFQTQFNTKLRLIHDQAAKILQKIENPSITLDSDSAIELIFKNSDLWQKNKANDALNIAITFVNNASRVIVSYQGKFKGVEIPKLPTLAPFFTELCTHNTVNFDKIPTCIDLKFVEMFAQTWKIVYTEVYRSVVDVTLSDQDCKEIQSYFRKIRSQSNWVLFYSILCILKAAGKTYSTSSELIDDKVCATLLEYSKDPNVDLHQDESNLFNPIYSKLSKMLIDSTSFDEKTMEEFNKFELKKQWSLENYIEFLKWFHSS